MRSFDRSKIAVFYYYSLAFNAYGGGVTYGTISIKFCIKVRGWAR